MKGKLVPVENVLKVSYKDAANMGIDGNTFGRAIKVLIKIGLIEVVEKGVFGGRRPATYKII